MLYGRRRGRRLRPGRQRLLAERLPGISIALPAAGERLDPATLFAGDPGDIWLEIGFGAGEHLAWQAEHHPDVGLMGCEPFVTGVAKLLGEVAGRSLGNIRVLMDDARVLLSALPDRCIGRVFILFPDPWPKKRHHRRRIVGAETLRELGRVMRPGAELRVATDHIDYGRWILAHGLAEPAFEWLANRADDWRRRPGDWPETRYEAKAAAAGRKCLYFRFRRRS